MGVQPATRAAVEEVIGSHGDPTVLEYVINVLDDDDFDFGPGGREAYDAFGEMLVRNIKSLCTYRKCTDGPYASQVAYLQVLRSRYFLGAWVV